MKIKNAFKCGAAQNRLSRGKSKRENAMHSVPEKKLLSLVFLHLFGINFYSFYVRVCDKRLHFSGSALIAVLCMHVWSFICVFILFYLKVKYYYLNKNGYYSIVFTYIYLII